MLLRIITKLDDQKGLHEEELPGVLWAYRTTARSPTGKTLFALTYGTKAVIPVEIGALAQRVVNFTQENNEEGKKLDLDFLEEIREKARLRMEP